MIEYKIHTFADIKSVKTIWKKFLIGDKTWHFTLEGDYIEIRVAKRIPALEKYLTKKKLKYDRFEYINAIDTTRKYQKQFEKIFHGLAELSMIVPREADFYNFNSELRKVTERAVYLSFNILGYDLKNESNVMAALLIDRSYYFGYYNAQVDAARAEKQKISAMDQDGPDLKRKVADFRKMVKGVDSSEVLSRDPKGRFAIKNGKKRI